MRDDVKFAIAQAHTRYGRFFFFPNDDPIGACLHFYGEWAQQEFSLFDKFLTKNSCVLDIGANIGTHAVYFSKKCHEGLVVAVEPQLYIHQLLSTNLLFNACLNTIPVMAGASSERKSIKVINIDPLSPSPKLNYGEFKLKDEDKGAYVECYPIDYLSRQFERLDLIKIDVEGLEVDVLNGAKQTLSKFKSHLYLEFNAKQGAPDLYEKIIQLDYVPYWHVYTKFNPDNFNRQTQNIWELDNFVIDESTLDKRYEANIICIHKDNEQPTGLKRVEEGENITTYLKAEGLLS